MKPIKLVLKNIGPFLDEVLDFTKLDNMFLITGNTGAGKTFIFDAMTYALYGVLKGSRSQQIKSLHSDYADKKDKSSVEFTFLAGEKSYRVHRTVSYTYLTKKGTESTKSQEVDFCVLTGGAYTPVTNAVGLIETNKMIERVVGLSSEEFSQVVLLPQGEFAKFLKQSSKDRRDTLLKLFPVEQFTRIMESVTEDSKKKEFELKALKDQIIDIESKHDFNNAQNKIEELYAQVKNLEDTLQKLQDKRAQIVSDKNKIDEQLKQAKEYENNKMQLANLKGQEADFKNIENNINRAQKALTLKSAIDKKDRSFERLNKCTTKNDGAKKNCEDAKNTFEEIKQNEKVIDDLRTQLERDNTISTQLDTKIENAKKWGCVEQGVADKVKRPIKDEDLTRPIDSEVRSAFENRKLGKDRDKLLNELNCLEKNNSNLKTEYDELVTIIERDEKTLEEVTAALKKQEVMNTAATVAQSLIQGKPCPVCGSLSHPNIAKCVESLLTYQNQKTTCEKNIKAHNASLARLSAKIGENNGTLITKKSALENYKDIPDTKILDSEYKNILQIFYDVCCYQKTLKESIKNNDSKIKKFDNDFNLAKKNKDIFETTLKNAQEDLQDAKNSFENDDKTLESEINRSIFKTEKEVLDSYLTDRQLENEQQKLQAYKEELKKFETLVERGQKDNYSIDTLQKNKNELDSNLKQVEQAISSKNGTKNSLKRDADILQDAYDNYIEVKSKFEKTNKEFAPLNLLSRDLSGANPKKIPFDAWALGMYFQEIVALATKRFYDLSKGRYQFLLNSNGSGNSYKGLDLQVCDSFTGQSRDVATLSGGETFEASISLALATTDIVQNQNGAMTLDSLFIDEGFGTLDSETLDRAMEILNELQETKMVGVISHVDTLEQAIKSKIEVEKTNCGSHIKIIG